MRLNIHVLAVLAVTAIACGGEQPEPETAVKVSKVPVEEPKPLPSATTSATPVEPPAPKLTMVEMQKKAIAGVVAAFNAHDAKKLASLYSADAAVRMPSNDGWKDDKGRDAIEKSHVGLFTAVPDSKMGTTRVMLKGDVAVWEWIATGTDSVGMGGDKPTNKPVGFQAASVLWFDADGAIKVDHTYFDSATIAGQLGKLPKDMKVRPVAALPAGDGTWIESKGGDGESKNVDALKGVYTAFEKGDEKAFLSLLDDKASHSELSMPGDVVGKDAAKKEFQGFRKAFPDIKFTADQAWGIGDVVVAEVTIAGTQNGPLGPMKASKKKVTLHALDISDASGGKFVKMTTYGNGAEMMAQIAPPKKEAPKPKEAPKDAPKK
jgi:predicted ester cyclase